MVLGANGSSSFRDCLDGGAGVFFFRGGGSGTFSGSNGCFFSALAAGDGEGDGEEGN